MTSCAHAQTNLHDDVDSVVEVTRLNALDPVGTPSRQVTQLQYVTGLKVTAGGLLACARLRQDIDFLQVIYFDWPHTFLQEGVLTNELTKFLYASVHHEVGLDAVFLAFSLEGWLELSLPTPRKAEDLAPHIRRVSDAA